MKMVLNIILVAAFGVSFAMCAHAQTISINNASFESPALDGNAYVEGAVPEGWTLVQVEGFVGSQFGAGYQANGSGYAPPDAIDGTQSALLKGAGGMYQTISGFTAGQTYTISFYAAGRYGNLANNQDNVDTNPFRVLVGDSLAKATALNFTVSGISTTVLSPDAASNSSGKWTLYTTTFTATNSTQVLEFLSALDASPNMDRTTFIDKVSITSVPEPATTALGLMGVSGLLVCAWQTRRRT